MTIQDNKKIQSLQYINTILLSLLTIISSIGWSITTKLISKQEDVTVELARVRTIVDQHTVHLLEMTIEDKEIKDWVEKSFQRKKFPF